MGCPFDGPPYYIGFDAASQSAKRVISLKGIPYFRTLDDDEHPFTEALYTYYDSLPCDDAKVKFAKVLDDMLLAFLLDLPSPLPHSSQLFHEGTEPSTF